MERPRPRRAENWRSERSARNIGISIETLNDLAQRLAADQPDIQRGFVSNFVRTEVALDAVGDPVFANITDPIAWFALKDVQSNLNQAWQVAEEQLGPSLGISAGFNALDGD